MPGATTTNYCCTTSAADLLLLLRPLISMRVRLIAPPAACLKDTTRALL